MKPRAVASRISEALTDTPIVFVQGARQVGKSTLVQAIGAQLGARYMSLDDEVVRAAALSDPVGFVGGLGDVAVIDEVQRAEGLLLAIKSSVDRDRRPGRFLLTGSANVLSVPKIADSLAGRMEIITLHPFSQSEVERTDANIVEMAFADDIGPPGVESGEPRAATVQRILRGGFPEVQTREQAHRREAWFSSYVSALLQRDIRDLANLEQPEELARLLAIVASRTSGLLSYSNLGRDSALTQSTLKRYFGLLELAHLIRRLPAWTTNRGVRLVKSPKVHVCDSGLAAHLTGMEDEFLGQQGSALGPLLETFVVQEVIKHIGWSQVRARPFHFRTSDGREVDLVLERPSGGVVGFEIKSSETVRAKDFQGLELLERQTGAHFSRGIVLYLGSETVSFGRSMIALPVASLWT